MKKRIIIGALVALLPIALLAQIAPFDLMNRTVAGLEAAWVALGGTAVSTESSVYGLQTRLAEAAEGIQAELAGGIVSTNLPNLTVTNAAAFLSSATVGGTLASGSGTFDSSSLAGTFRRSGDSQSIKLERYVSGAGHAYLGADSGNAFIIWGTGEAPDTAANRLLIVGQVTGQVGLKNSAFIGWSSTAGAGQSDDLFLYRDAAGTLAQRNGTTAQTNRIYGTWTDASNYKRLALYHDGTDAIVAAESAGTGGADQNLVLKAQGAGTVTVGAGIAATVDVLVSDTTTNRLVFVGGILVSNITNYAP